MLSHDTAISSRLAVGSPDPKNLPKPPATAPYNYHQSGVPIPGAGTGAKATQGKNYTIYQQFFFKFARIFGSFIFAEIIRIYCSNGPIHLLRNTFLKTYNLNKFIIII